MSPGELDARILNLIKVGRISLVNDGDGVQVVQITLPSVGSDGLPIAHLPRLIEFGFTSSPPVGAEAVIVSLQGERSRGMVVATNHQASRLKNLKAGDSAVYDVRGAYAWFQAGGLVVDAAGLAVTIQNFSSCTIKGDLHVTGDVVAGFGGAAVSVLEHQHPLQGPGVPQTGAPLPE